MWATLCSCLHLSLRGSWCHSLKDSGRPNDLQELREGHWEKSDPTFCVTQDNGPFLLYLSIPVCPMSKLVAELGLNTVPPILSLSDWRQNPLMMMAGSVPYSCCESTEISEYLIGSGLGSLRTHELGRPLAGDGNQVADSRRTGPLPIYTHPKGSTLCGMEEKSCFCSEDLLLDSPPWATPSLFLFMYYLFPKKSTSKIHLKFIKKGKKIIE